MRVLFVVSECAPFVKTGGLADVASALPKALSKIGIQTRVLLPGYPAVTTAVKTARTALDLGRMYGGGLRLLEATAEGLELLILDAPHLFDRPGNPYLGPDRKDWPDNHLRFGALCQVAAQLAREGVRGWRPDMLHAHDWQAGLAPAHLKLSRGAAPASVMTIHNIAFQGLFPANVLRPLGLSARSFTPDGLEYYGKIGFLKAGLVYADRITTVSPTYARELATPKFGMGLEGVIASRRTDLTGILNGVEVEIWDPEADPHIAAPYSVRRLSGKARNRGALVKAFGLEARAGAPLFCVISRLTRQKGLDLLLEALPRLEGRAAQLVILGTGESDLEGGYRAAAERSKGSLGVAIRYDEALAHLMMAGADAILVPSRFEPCGLTQLYGLRYGTLPLVARTGGLADTVIDANEAALTAGTATGFQFAPDSLDALCDAIDRACDLFEDKRTWRALMRRAMRHPVGWETSAKVYASLYASTIEGR